jgi:hypothetical protein
MARREGVAEKKNLNNLCTKILFKNNNMKLTVF